jgi:hypothetical protein
MRTRSPGRRPTSPRCPPRSRAAEQAVAIRPDYQQALVDLGSYELRLGDTFAGQPDVAQRWYEKALTALESARAIDEKSTARFVEKMRARGNPTTRSPTSATPSSSTTSRSPT